MLELSIYIYNFLYYPNSDKINILKIYCFTNILGLLKQKMTKDLIVYLILSIEGNFL